MCPRDYTPVLLQYIDRENLPEYLGGTSKASHCDLPSTHTCGEESIVYNPI